MDASINLGGTNGSLVCKTCKLSSISIAPQQSLDWYTS